MHRYSIDWIYHKLELFKSINLFIFFIFSEVLQLANVTLIDVMLFRQSLDKSSLLFSR